MRMTIPNVEHAARVLSRAALMIVSFAIMMSVSRADDATPADVKRALTEFTSAWDDRLWEPAEGRLSLYLRPMPDAGWKKRMQTLQTVARQGSVASVELRPWLQSDSVVQRLFAAQALGYCGNADAQPELAHTLEHDDDPAVRLHAADSLGMLGGQAHAELLQRLEKSEKNNDTRRHIRYALERNGQAVDPAIVKQLKDWPTSQLDTAALGKLAPDFELTSLSGEKVRLSDFRGKKSVVLVFVYGDT